MLRDLNKITIVQSGRATAVSSGLLVSIGVTCFRKRRRNLARNLYSSILKPPRTLQRSAPKATHQKNVAKFHAMNVSSVSAVPIPRHVPNFVVAQTACNACMSEALTA